jgi:hypothetical protein
LKNYRYVTLFTTLAVLLCVAFAFCGNARADDQEGWVKIKLDDATRKKMGVFISNFTELDICEIDTTAMMKYGDFVYFGAMHNYINNPKAVKKANDGRISVSGNAVFRAVDKYFSLGEQADPKEGRLSAKYDGIAFEYKGGSYVFKNPAKRVIYYADVKEAYKFDGLVLMKGQIYEKDNPKNVTGPFYAWAEPWNFDGKDTWALVAIHRGEHDGSPWGYGG